MNRWIRVTTAVFCIILCVIPQLLSFNVSSNPIAIESYDMSPVPANSNETGIRFVSEYVEYIIDSVGEVHVEATYSFENTKTTNQKITIWLPFYNDAPYDLEIHDKYAKINFNIKQQVDNSSIPYSFCAEFNISFYPSQIQNVTATYSDSIEHKSGVFSDEYQCSYLSESGKYWNNSLDNATFRFKINKDIHTSGLNGYIITQEQDYIVATLTLHDWIPDRNISIRWNNTTISQYLCISVIIIGIICLLLLVFYLIKSKPDPARIQNDNDESAV
jgi:hypothetical protein